MRKNDYEEDHNFVVAKNSAGKYLILDLALYNIVKLDDINSPYDLLYLNDVKITNSLGDNISYYSRLSYEQGKTV